jgi:hypothetical protein
VVFKLSKQELAECKALAADLRKHAGRLNTAIVASNAAVEPLSQAVGEEQEDYNGILEKSHACQQRHRCGSAEIRCKWQQGDTGIQVRCWIDQWEMDLDDVDLELPEPLTEIDPDEHGGRIEGAPPDPTA